jgi:hypothetical protein
MTAQTHRQNQKSLVLVGMLVYNSTRFDARFVSAVLGRCDLPSEAL